MYCDYSTDSGATSSKSTKKKEEVTPTSSSKPAKKKTNVISLFDDDEDDDGGFGANNDDDIFADLAKIAPSRYYDFKNLISEFIYIYDSIDFCLLPSKKSLR